jgi:hypothetical protein
MVRFVAAILRPIGGFCPDGHWRGISATMPILARVAGNRNKAAGANPWTGGETEPRAVARRRQSITSRDISARTRAATPLLETSGELAAIFFLFTKMQDAKPLGFFVLLAELAGGVFGDGVGFARGGGGRECDLVDAAIG